MNNRVHFDHHIIAFDVLSSVASNLGSACKPRDPPPDSPLASARRAGCHLGIIRSQSWLPRERIIWEASGRWLGNTAQGRAEPGCMANRLQHSGEARASGIMAHDGSKRTPHSAANKPPGTPHRHILHHGLTLRLQLPWEATMLRILRSAIEF